MRGFTLIEVVMALLVLEVGILGAVGVLLLASETLTHAEVVERGVLEAEAALDSLQAGVFPTSGLRERPDGTLSWKTSVEGTVRVRYRSHAFGVVIDVSGPTLLDSVGAP